MTTVPVSMQNRIPIPAGTPRVPQAGFAMTPGDIVRILKQRIFLILFFSRISRRLASALKTWAAYT